MELLNTIQNDVLKQKEEETANVFMMVANFREFILTNKPNTDVTINLEMCCLDAERLNRGHRTHVILVDAPQRTVFEPTANALSDITPLKLKPHLAQVTLWYTTQKKGLYGKPNVEFQPGANCKFRNVDGVCFFVDIAKGNGQYERGNNYKIFETEPPLKKRNVTAYTATKPKKNKNQALPVDNSVMRMKTEKNGESNAPVATTRSKQGDPSTDEVCET